MKEREFKRIVTDLVQECVDHLGGQLQLAIAVKVSPSAITRWIKGERIPMAYPYQKMLTIAAEARKSGKGQH
jgi:hypothetical protein